MIITHEPVEAVLRVAWPEARLAGEPVPVTGGQWATMFRVVVRGAPDGVPPHLVLRVVPHAELGGKELAVQEAAAAAGVATPTVRMSGPAGGPLGGAWALMDFAPGMPLLAGLDGPAAVRRFPTILARLPRQLADTMAGVHRVDPGPVIDRARAAAPGVALTVDELLDHLRAGAEAVATPSLPTALDRLADNRPDHTGSVLCHGDLHPFNVLADGDRLTVLDWTAAIVAPPAYDAAFTWLLLRYPPLQAPPALRPVITGAAALLARRFVHRYRIASSSAGLDGIDWYAALHAIRVLVDLAGWERDGDPRATTHPFRLVAPGAARVLARATGVEVSAG